MKLSKGDQRLSLLLLVVLLFPLTSCKEKNSSLIIILLSQNYESNFEDINQTLSQWSSNLQQLNLQMTTTLITTHTLFSDMETRSVLPVLTKLYTQYNTTDWFLLAKQNTIINFSLLTKLLKNYKDPHLQPYYLGHGLQDQKLSMIHHFAPIGEDSIMYPLECAGYVMSREVLRRAADKWMDFNPTFTIDPLFELSLFLKYMRYPSPSELHPQPPPTHPNGVLLTHVTELCAEETQHYHSNQCVTTCKKIKLNCKPAEDVFIAIKTCQKYHEHRIPIQLKTWVTLQAPPTMQYFSDVEDERYRTISVGVTNTERGHCTKLLTILQKVIKHKKIKWIIIADDDTLLSIPRLLSFLGCHDNNIPLIIGELYGYQSYIPHGYLYPTAGSGVILSRVAVEMITSSGITCPSHDYPDDMFLGTLAKMLDITLVHSSLFHQNQPENYHPKTLSLEESISFHRLSPEDPVTIYETFLVNNKGTTKDYRTEL